MTRRERLYRLTAALLHTLESEGKAAGTGQHLRVLDLLRHLPEDTDDDALLLALTPLLAQNKAEQEGIYEKFRDCARALDALAGDAPAREQLQVIEKQQRKWLWRMIVPGTVLLLAALVFWWWASRPVPVIVLDETMGVPLKQRSDIRLDSLQGVLEIGHLTRADEPAGTTQARRNFGEYTLQPPVTLAVTAADSVGLADSVYVDLVFDNGEKRGLNLKIQVVQPAGVIVDPGPPDQPLFSPVPSPRFPHDLKALALEAPDPRLQWLADNWYWLRWPLFLCFTALLLALWQWLEWRRRKLIAEQSNHDRPPYVWNIRLGEEEEIVAGDQWNATLQVLRRRGSADTQRLDLPKTIHATAQAGGMPAFRFRRLTRPVDYLLLLDRQSVYNHRAQLYDALYQAFRAQEIEIERFYYDSDIRHCYNEAFPHGLRPAELAQRFPDARLIVVGAGYQLLHPENGRPAEWTAVFRQWKERVLLTPRPADDWGRDERRLAELFTLLPASLQSLQFWVEELDSEQDARFDDWRKRVHDAPRAVWQPDPVLPLPMLQMQYDDATVRWVAACAIFPTLHWDLTLWLGRRLSPAAGVTLPTLERLQALFRLQWFVEGHIPVTAREALLDWLEATDKPLLDALRLEMAELLRRHAPPPGSVAWNEHAMSVALTEWMAATDPARRRALEQQIADLLAAGTPPDFAVLKYLDRPRGRFDFEVPRAWRRYVHPGGFRALGWQTRWRSLWRMALPWLAGACALLYPWAWVHETACNGATVPYIVDNETYTLCLDSPADSLLWAEHLLLDTLEHGSLAAFDSLDTHNLRAVAGYPTDTTAREVNANLAAALYNQGVAAYGNSPDNASRTAACDLFARTARYDTLTPEYRKARAYCSAGAAIAVPAPKIQGECRRVADVGAPVALRNRDLTDNPSPRNAVPLLRLATLAAGATVTLLDSTRYAYHVYYKGLTGYISKQYGGRYTLVPCKGTGVVITYPFKIPEMVFVKGGTYEMGSEKGEDNEKPVHPVTVSDFEIGQYEVTVAEYLAFADETKSHYPEWLEPGSEYNVETGTKDYYKSKGYSRSAGTLPVAGVSWDDANAFCQWLTKKTGRTYRLPTEAEWEYAARGGAGSRGFTYAGSNTIDEVAWYDGNSGSKPHPVGQLAPNELKVYDMSGNLWEWCHDWYDDYPKDAQKDPQGPTDGSGRVIRGGSWSSTPANARVSHRNGWYPGDRDFSLGFRLARTP